MVNFNPRSREGSDGLAHTAWPVTSHFNPRSREGSDDCLAWWRWIVPISIHAPVKGATVCGRTWGPYSDISIHAPVKGATPDIAIQGISNIFQSTLP